MCTMNYQRHAALTGKSVQNANFYANCKGMEFFIVGTYIGPQMSVELHNGSFHADFFLMKSNLY